MYTIKATEARALSDRNAPIVAQRLRDFAAEQAAEKKAAERTKRKKWRDTFELRVRDNILHAVRQGKTECMVGIGNYQDYPYHAFSDFAVYETCFEYKKDLNIIIRHLKQDGYKSVVDRNSYFVDDTAAYMNSGGECGSESTYWASDIVLKVSW